MGSGFGSLYPLTGQLLSPSSIDKLVKQLKFLENKGQEKTDDCEQLLQSREREREREQGWVLSFLGTQREKIEDIQANI